MSFRNRDNIRCAVLFLLVGGFLASLCINPSWRSNLSCRREYKLKRGEALVHGDITMTLEEVKTRYYSGFQVRVASSRFGGEKVVRPSGATPAFGYYVTVRAVMKGNPDAGEVDTVNLTVWGDSSDYYGD